MKTTVCGICILLLGCAFYFAEKDSIGLGNSSMSQQSVQNSEKSVALAEKSAEKKCACCNRKLSLAKEKAKQRQQARETWARQMIANHGYEEGMRKIAAKSPWLAKQIQRILDKEKRLGEVPTLSELDTQ